jgi:hypothetical protein
VLFAVADDAFPRFANISLVFMKNAKAQRKGKDLTEKGFIYAASLARKKAAKKGEQSAVPDDAEIYRGLSMSRGWRRIPKTVMSWSSRLDD